MHTSIIKRFPGCAVLILSLILVSSPAAAGEGDHFLRFTFSHFEPTGSTFTWINPEPLYGSTGRIDTDPQGSSGFAAEYEYRPSDRWGIGVQLARTDAEFEVTHHVALQHPPHYIAELTMTPLTISPRFHLLPGDSIDLYAGPLLGYVFYGDLVTP
jgi:hypothetical protein